MHHLPYPNKKSDEYTNPIVKLKNKLHDCTLQDTAMNDVDTTVIILVLCSIKYVKLITAASLRGSQ